jgi:FkbM family methyltransferase
MATYEEQVDLLLAEDVDAVKERERTAFDRLLAEANGRIVLFGAGNLGRKALRCLRSIGIEPLAFADNDEARWGIQADGVDVLSPEEAADRFGSSAMFMVTIWSLGHAFRETHAKLKSLGCRTVLPSASLRWKFANELLPDYCQELPHKVYEQADEVRTAARLWADDESRFEYLNQIRWRALGDYDCLSGPHREEQYFPESLFHLIPGEVFVDCGAYDGDTAKRFISRNADFGRLLAIEPDPENYRRLCQWAKSQIEVKDRILTYGLAVGASSGTVRFNATGAEGASIAKGGGVLVECASLDELAADVAPTYIKMDLEGAEEDALQGASRLIQEHSPILAVCLYHRPSDLWRIPSLILSLVDNYKLFLRPHFGDGWDLVYYAVPPHRLRSTAEVDA